MIDKGGRPRANSPLQPGRQHKAKPLPHYPADHPKPRLKPEHLTVPSLKKFKPEPRNRFRAPSPDVKTAPLVARPNCNSTNITRPEFPPSIIPEALSENEITIRIINGAIDHWAMPGYELRGDEMDFFVNIINVIAADAQIKSYAFPWFAGMKRLFTTNRTLINHDFDENNKHRKLFITKSRAQKKVL
jgi:hypothetical protein